MLRFAIAGFCRSARWIVDLVLPPRCPACGVTVETQGTFCGPCWGSLRFLEAGEGCACCGEPAGRQTAFDGWRCWRCLRDPPSFACARAAFVYDGAIRRAILAFKHRDRGELAAMLARHMARAGISLLETGQMDAMGVVVVPVPLHRWRLWVRGFNQAALLAREVARLTGRDWLPDALERVRMTRAQQGLNRAERLRNLSGAFRVPPRHQERLRGRTVILVDDVLTTGSTAQRCAQALLKAGAGEVRVLTLARVAVNALEALPESGVAADARAIHIAGAIRIE